MDADMAIVKEVIKSFSVKAVCDGSVLNLIEG